MRSYSANWENGIENWSVFHDCENDPNPIETTGTLPPDFNLMVSAINKQINDGNEYPDYFEIPIKLIENRIDFRYDADLPVGGESVFRTLAPRSYAT